MAITYTGGQVEINSHKHSGTATGGSASTITGSGWTSGALVGYHVMVTGGTGGSGLGQSRLITANTANIITVYPGWETAPDNTSTYVVPNRLSDVVAAVGTYVTDLVTSTSKQVNSTKNIVLKSGGSLSMARETLQFTVAQMRLITESGSYFVSGNQANAEFPNKGSESCRILWIGNTSGYWGTGWEGRMHLYATEVYITRVASDTSSVYAYINYPVTTYTSTGIRIRNCTMSGFSFYMGVLDDIVGLDLRSHIVLAGADTAVSTANMPARMESVSGPISLRSTADGGTGVGGEDIIDYKSISPTTYDFFLYLFTLSRDCVIYLWNPLITNAWVDAFDWFQAGYNGVPYRGYLVGIKTLDSAGADLGAVAVGLLDTNDDGAIMTSKSSLLPVMSKAITTDVNGDYTGIVGTDKGLPVIYSKYAYLSQYVSTETLYAPFKLYVIKYGYVEQVQVRNWTAEANEATYSAVNPFLVANYATAIAYTGMSVTPSTKTIAVTTANTVQKLRDFVAARVDYEAKTNDVIVDVDVANPFLTTDGANDTLPASWTLVENGNLDYGTERISGGTIQFDAASSYSPTLGTCTIDFTAASGTYDLRAGDFTGTITITNSGGGSITVQMPVGVSVTNTGPNITLEQTASVNITVTGFSTTSRLQIYDVDNTTELYNDVVGTTSKVLPYTYTVDVDIRIRIADDGSGGADAMDFIETTQTMGTGGLTYGATQVADAVYNANAVDGSGVTSITITDAAPDLVNCNIAGGTLSWHDIYAYFVYWMQTATGIAYDIVYISAVDQANYILDGIQIRNTHANPLSITDGYGVDATTGVPADIFDDAGSTGNIYQVPPHVINNIVTVGGVNIITGDIADLNDITAAEVRAEMDSSSTKLADALTTGQFIALK